MTRSAEFSAPPLRSRLITCAETRRRPKEPRPRGTVREPCRVHPRSSVANFYAPLLDRKSEVTRNPGTKIFRPRMNADAHRQKPVIPCWAVKSRLPATAFQPQGSNSRTVRLSAYATRTFTDQLSFGCLHRSSSSVALCSLISGVARRTPTDAPYNHQHAYTTDLRLQGVGEVKRHPWCSLPAHE